MRTNLSVNRRNGSYTHKHTAHSGMRKGMMKLTRDRHRPDVSAFASLNDTVRWDSCPRASTLQTDCRMTQEAKTHSTDGKEAIDSIEQKRIRNE